MYIFDRLTQAGLVFVFKTERKSTKFHLSWSLKSAEGTMGNFQVTLAQTLEGKGNFTVGHCVPPCVGDFIEGKSCHIDRHVAVSGTPQSHPAL